jgi:integrase/recombinase XerD
MDLIYLMKREMRRRGYSERSVKAYGACVSQFMKKCKKEPKKFTKKDVKEYLYYLADRGKARSTLNLHLQAIKFALKNILGKRYVLDIPSTRKAKRLPIVLTRKEVNSLFDAISNDKHRFMVKLMYSAGLRVSELVNLKVEDLDIENNYGWVRKGKGNKDRVFIIAESLKEDLKKCEEGYLFKGRRGHISVRSIQMIVKNACRKAKIKKRVSCHTLRHSFATHLVEDNCPIPTVQNLLGHESIETTMIYVHTSNPSLLGVRSPLDNC